MITQILEALEKGELLFVKLPNESIVIENTNKKIHGETHNKMDNETTQKHSNKLKTFVSCERSGLVLFSIEGTKGTFMFNIERQTAIHNSRMKTSKATERLVYKQLVPEHLSLKYLKKLEHISPLGKYHQQVEQELRKQLNYSSN